MILDTLLHTIEQYKLIATQRWVIVAVSGGVDSVALLHLLVEARERLDFLLHCATLDHGLRGLTGKADAEWVTQLCEELNVPVTAGYANTRQVMIQHTLGVEAAARKARYDFLASVATSIGCNTIMTAHHADDQAETILMHILRGASLAGITGMAYRSTLPGYPDLTLARPLLNVSRKIIESYCAENQLTFCLDETNSDTDYTRNRIRHEILPQLETVNPQITASLNRLGEIARIENDFIQQTFESDVKPYIQMQEQRIIVERDIFLGWHPALQQRCIRQCVLMLQPDNAAGFDHIIAASQIILKGQVGSITVFPGKVRLRIDYDAMIFETADSPQEPMLAWRLPRGSTVPVKIPGRTAIPGESWRLCLRLTTDGQHLTQLQIPVDSRGILRTRRPGDRIHLHGGHQKLKKWFIDRKIPQNQRDFIPLLVINEEIAAIFYDNICYITESFKVVEANFVGFYVFVET